MDYGMIGKIEKAKRYAEEHERFHFHKFTVNVDGSNNTHLVTFNEGEWSCNCDFFQSRGRCSHTLALEFILEGMLAEKVKSA